jgi:hypothetical protein
VDVGVTGKADQQCLPWLQHWSFCDDSHWRARSYLLKDTRNRQADRDDGSDQHAERDQLANAAEGAVAHCCTAYQEFFESAWSARWPRAQAPIPIAACWPSVMWRCIIGRNTGAGMTADEYALEKLMQAVDALATGVGPVQDRLGDAAIYLVPVRPEDISDEDLRRIFIGVMDDLSYARVQDDEGGIFATLRITNDEDAIAIARRILDLYHKLDRLLRER